MHRSALAVLACPQCHGRLDCADIGEELEHGTLRCVHEGVEYPIIEAVPRLVRPGREGVVDSFGRKYSRAWTQDGWGASNPSYLLALPYRDLTQRATSRWKVKARSMEALVSLLGELRPRRILDLGCGVGWLSYHLAARGYEMYALDAVLDDVLGLAAAATYIRAGAFFERVWGELENPPFLDASFDAVVCNASLHYGRWEETVASVARLLHPGGVLIVMNSPVHRELRSATRAATDFQSHLRQLGADEEIVSSYHHFERNRLEAEMAEFIGPVQEQPFDPGLGFRSFRALKGVMLGMDLARFPILWARKPSAR